MLSSVCVRYVEITLYLEFYILVAVIVAVFVVVASAVNYDDDAYYHN